MKRKIINILIASSIVFALAACSGQGDYYPETDDYVSNGNEIIEDEPEQDTTQEETSDMSDQTGQSSPQDPPQEDYPHVESVNQISEYGRQVASEFISGFTTIFTGVLQADLYWDDETGTSTPTGRFILGWDVQTNQLLTTDEVPEIYFIPSWAGEGGFFDRHGNRIDDALWLDIRRGDDLVSYSYANYFKLFDFDNNGIPVIFVHFNQTFDGGYAGSYGIFRYVNGEYRMLAMVSFVDGVEYSAGWIGSFHEIFMDDNGRIIVFANSEYHGALKYEHLILTNERAELHLVADMGNWEDNWEAWREHHWDKWEETPDGWIQVDNWKFNNPTIFGTDIPITPIEPLVELQEEIMEELS